MITYIQPTFLDVQMFQCSNVPMFKYSNVQMFQCSNVPLLQCSIVQMFKCSNIQWFECQMSISFNFCRSIPPVIPLVCFQLKKIKRSMRALSQYKTSNGVFHKCRYLQSDRDQSGPPETFYCTEMC